MTHIPFGTITIPAIWVAVPLALLIASLFYGWMTRTKAGDWFWNGFLLYVLSWKLSYIAFHPKMFLHMPLSIAYFNGGTKGHFLALALLSCYLLFIASKKYPSIYKEAAPLFLLFFAGYEALIQFIEQHVEVTLFHTGLLAGYLYVFSVLHKKKIALSAQNFIVMAMLEFLMVSLFRSVSMEEMLTFSWMGITVLILSENKKEGQHT